MSIALEDGDGVVAGVVYDPPRDELWAGVRGGDALLDGERVRGSDRDVARRGAGLDRLRLRRRRAPRAGEATVAQLLPDVRDIRRFGVAALDLAGPPRGATTPTTSAASTTGTSRRGGLVCECAGLGCEPLAPTPPQGEGILVATPALIGELRARVA